MARILIVEDDEALSRLLSEALESWGYDVDAVGDGTDGYERVYLAPAGYDVVLLDLELPRMPGPTFLRNAAGQLRERTPVVIMTGEQRMLDALGETRRWAFGVLKKPFELQHMREMVEHALKQRAVYVTARRQAERIQELETRVRDLVTQNQALFEEARLDALTRLPNRRRLQEDLGRLRANAERYARPFAFALFDVDDFRRYNSKCGYTGGDRAIQWVADLLREAVRRGDSVYRFGGDEFVVVMEAQGIEQAVIAAERLRAHVAARSRAEDAPVEGPVTMSAGVVAVEAGAPRSVTQLVQQADRLLRSAKASGGDRVHPEVERSALASNGV